MSTRFTPERIRDLQTAIDSMPMSVAFSTGRGVHATLVELLNLAVNLDRALDESAAIRRADVRRINTLESQVSTLTAELAKAKEERDQLAEDLVLRDRQADDAALALSEAREQLAEAQKKLASFTRCDIEELIDVRYGHERAKTLRELSETQEALKLSEKRREALQTASERFIEKRGFHNGEHIFKLTSCTRCNESYIHAEEVFDFIVRSTGRAALSPAPSAGEPSVRCGAEPSSTCDCGCNAEPPSTREEPQLCGKKVWRQSGEWAYPFECSSAVIGDTGRCSVHQEPAPVSSEATPVNYRPIDCPLCKRRRVMANGKCEKCGWNADDPLTEATPEGKTCRVEVLRQRFAWPHESVKEECGEAEPCSVPGHGGEK
jgi:hypothetical protein